MDENHICSARGNKKAATKQLTEAVLRFTLDLNYFENIELVMDGEPASKALLASVKAARQSMGFATMTRVTMPFDKGPTSMTERALQSVRRQAATLVAMLRINPKHMEKLNELCPQRHTKKLPCGHDALEEDTTPELSGTKVKEFRSMVGLLLYLVSDRPDLAFVVRTLSSKMAVPTEKAYKLAIGAVAYLRGTNEVGIKFKKNWPGKMVLDTRNDRPGGHAGYHVVEAVADADFAGDKTTRRSISGGQVYINGNVCLAYSRTQKNISLSKAILIKKAWAFLAQARQPAKACDTATCRT